MLQIGDSGFVMTWIGTECLGVFKRRKEREKKKLDNTGTSQVWYGRSEVLFVVEEVRRDRNENNILERCERGSS